MNWRAMKDGPIEAEWRCGIDTVGIVIVKRQRIEKLTAYMGVSRGLSESSDMRFIASYGCKLSYEEAKAFFNWIEKEDYSEQQD